MATTGMFRVPAAALSLRVRERPFIPGSMMSVSTRSAGNFSARASASSALTARTTSMPADSRTSATSFRLAGLSSTMRIFILTLSVLLLHDGFYLRGKLAGINRLHDERIATGAEGFVAGKAVRVGSDRDN